MADSIDIDQDAYIAEITKELEELKRKQEELPTEYKERRIRELTKRLQHMGVVLD